MEMQGVLKFQERRPVLLIRSISAEAG